jgi:pimeloyl-ACP methyl ester carboxylesterase
VAELSGSLRVVTLDLPGHGLTGAVPGDDYSPDGMATFLDAFRKHLGLRHFYLGGNSMGGGVSFRFALAHPDVVDKLILVDSAGVKHLVPPDKVPEPPIGFRMARMPVLNRIAGFITPRSVVDKTALVAYGDPRLLTKRVSARLYDLLLYPGNRRATRLRFSEPVETTAADRLGEIHVPTLILWGEEDGMMPVDAGRIFHQRIAGSQLIEYPGVGHVPMEEIPERSAADVRAFLLGK